LIFEADFVVIKPDSSVWVKDGGKFNMSRIVVADGELEARLKVIDFIKAPGFLYGEGYELYSLHLTKAIE
jgi:hypothetical protein